MTSTAGHAMVTGSTIGATHSSTSSGGSLRGTRERVGGFEIPVHRALTEPILLGGAPRTVAIINGTLAAALGLGLQLWVAGALVWVLGHGIAVYAARKDPAFLDVLIRHLRHKGHLAC